MPLPSITLTTPLVLTAHSLCPTTVHGVSNEAQGINKKKLCAPIN